MELWIRSQDKTILSKAQNIIIRENQDENNETNYAIVDIYTMDIYKTKERALEVLDEIQELIKPTLICTEYHSEIKEFTVEINPNEQKLEYIQPQTILYEIPKE